MRASSTRLLVLMLICFLLFLPLSTSSTRGATEPSSPDQSTGPATRAGHTIPLRYDPAPSSVRIPPPQTLGMVRIQSATITVKYLTGGDLDGSPCYPWPEDAKSAFEYGVSIWASLIDSSVSIRINACWTELGEGILGSSGPTTFHRGFLGAPGAERWYQAALANALSGSDLNEADGYDHDGDGADADAEMSIAYNRSFPWYFGTGGEPAGHEIDFVSVVLHEVCHGLGFAGSMVKSGTLGYWGWGQSSYPAAYDQFTEEGGGGSGRSLLSYGSGTSVLGSALTSGNVFFDGANAREENGGVPPRLYAPPSWQPGSSYSHLDYDTFNDTENQLMVWALSSGESAHSPGPIALGILRDLGWTTNEAPAVPTIEAITPSGALNGGAVHVAGLRGNHFRPGASVKLARLNQQDIEALNVSVVDASLITCDFDLDGAVAGSWNVIVTNPDGLSTTLFDGFTVFDAADFDRRVHLPLMVRTRSPVSEGAGLGAPRNPDVTSTIQ